MVGRCTQVATSISSCSPRAFAPDRRLAGFMGTGREHIKALVDGHPQARRISNDRVQPETPKRRQGGSGKVGLPIHAAGHAACSVRVEQRIPGGALALRAADRRGAVFLEPNWAAMRQASPPGSARTVITANGRNIPWLALDLKREGLPPADLRQPTIAARAMRTGLPTSEPPCRRLSTSTCVSAKTITMPISC
jgi:hypothetical protein